MPGAATKREIADRLGSLLRLAVWDSADTRPRSRAERPGHQFDIRVLADELEERSGGEKIDSLRKWRRSQSVPWSEDAWFLGEILQTKVPWMCGLLMLWFCGRYADYVGVLTTIADDSLTNNELLRSITWSAIRLSGKHPYDEIDFLGEQYIGPLVVSTSLYEAIEAQIDPGQQYDNNALAFIRREYAKTHWIDFASLYGSAAQAAFEKWQPRSQLFSSEAKYSGTRIKPKRAELKEPTLFSGSALAALEVAKSSSLSIRTIEITLGTLLGQAFDRTGALDTEILLY